MIDGIHKRSICDYIVRWGFHLGRAQVKIPHPSLSSDQKSAGVAAEPCSGQRGEVPSKPAWRTHILRLKRLSSKSRKSVIGNRSVTPHIVNSMGRKNIVATGLSGICVQTEAVNDGVIAKVYQRSGNSSWKQCYAVGLLFFRLGCRLCWNALFRLTRCVLLFAFQFHLLILVHRGMFWDGAINCFGFFCTLVFLLRRSNLTFHRFILSRHVAVRF